MRLLAFLGAASVCHCMCNAQGSMPSTLACILTCHTPIFTNSLYSLQLLTDLAEFRGLPFTRQVHLDVRLAINAAQGRAYGIKNAVWDGFCCVFYKWVDDLDGWKSPSGVKYRAAWTYWFINEKKYKHHDTRGFIQRVVHTTRQMFCQSTRRWKVNWDVADTRSGQTKSGSIAFADVFPHTTAVIFGWKIVLNFII